MSSNSLWISHGELFIDLSAATHYTPKSAPSLTNLRMATVTIINNSNNISLDSIEKSIPVSTSLLTTSSTTSLSSSSMASSSEITSIPGGLVYASESADLTNAKGTFTGSSDINTLVITGTPLANSSNSLLMSSSNGFNAKKIKYGLIVSGMTFLLFVVSIC